jgi:hypothetical protein
MGITRRLRIGTRYRANSGMPASRFGRFGVVQGVIEGDINLRTIHEVHYLGALGGLDVGRFEIGFAYDYASVVKEIRRFLGGPGKVRRVSGLRSDQGVHVLELELTACGVAGDVNDMSTG